MRITGRKALLYLPARETCLGLVIPVPPIEIDSAGEGITYDFSGLKDASGEFTGYFDKDDNGKDPAGTSGA